MNDYEDDNEGGVMVATPPATAGVSVTVNAEIDRQIATAKRYPRSMKEFLDKATELVTLSVGIAEACMYSLPRGGKSLTGPSVRFAEMIANAYGNLRIGARVVDEGETMITSQGVCHDLERNVAITFETQRRITKKNGQRFDDDMIAVTGNAANSIALRNAILRVVPKALWQEAYDVARATAVGTSKTLTARREGMLDRFGKLGVTKEQVFALIEKPGIDDITLDDLERMIGIFTAIKDGKAIEEFFNPPQGDAKQKATEALKNAAQPKPAAIQPPPEAKPAPTLAQILDLIRDAATELQLASINESARGVDTLSESDRIEISDAMKNRLEELKASKKARK